MANQVYGYNPSSYTKVVGGGATGGSGGATNNFSSLYASRSVIDQYSPADPSLRGSSRFLLSDVLSSSSSAYSASYTDRATSSMMFSPPETRATARMSGLSVTTTPHFPSHSSWSGVDLGGSESLLAGLKRTSSEALYHQTLLDARNKIGQSEAWFYSNPVAKHPRYESASNLSIYPQRPGEKDCAHYMLTRTCKFGESCKFDHPIWVPDGGIPDWKEAPVVSDSLPERPGEPDCPYFLKTQKCKFGVNCKFNHPKYKITTSVTSECASALPERPSEPTCTFYLKTGNCKFGANCKFHHPKAIQIPSGVLDNGTYGQTDAVNSDLKPVKQPVPPATMHNSKGLPIRLGEVDCPFYVKTGSCKYGTSCRYNHPERYAMDPPTAALGPSIAASPATHLSFGFVNPAASILQTIDPRLPQTTLGMAPALYPQRLGQIECDYYMKTGECKFAERCKFHHPIDRSVPVPSAKDSQQQNIKLTLAGLPRREDAAHCPFYMKTGTCRYGATCKFDHPPPGEVMATSQGTSTAVEEDEEKS